MAEQGRKFTNQNGLTPKQNAFADRIIEQIATTGEPNATQAAMEVYDIKDRNTARAIGAENMTKPSIQEYLKNMLSSQGLTTEMSLAAIKELVEAKNYKMSGETKLKASIEVLKLLGVYPGSDKSPSHSQTNIFIGMGFDEARQKYEEINGTATSFISEATDL